MKVFKCSLCFALILSISFLFFGCVSAGMSDDEESDGYLISSLNDLVFVSKGDGAQTGEFVYQMVSHISHKVLDSLYDEYGESALALSRDADDTHKNAIYQDSWLWGGEWLPDIQQSGYTKTDFITDTVISYFSYNVYQVLLGKSPLTYVPNEFATNQDFIDLVDAQTFSEESLRGLANQVEHTGLFYYEIDSIAEYVLDYVIGEQAVTLDLDKFSDSNANATFDYVEFISSDTYKCIIKDYENQDVRNVHSTKSDVWNKINFAIGTTRPVIPTELGEQIAQEINLTLAQIQALPDSADKYTYVVLVEQTVEGEEGEEPTTILVPVTKYSGFKNYTNTTYFICYEARLNFEFTDSETSDTETVEDLLAMDHEPNITQDIYTPVQTVLSEQLGCTEELPRKQYKSILITTKRIFALNTFYMVFYTDADIADIQMRIKLRYHFTDDIYRQYIGSYSGESKTVEGELGTIAFGKDNPKNATYILLISKEDLATGKYKHVKLEDLPELSQMGVNNLVLNTYRPYAFLPGAVNPAWMIKEGYIATPSESFVGSNFNFTNEQSDYVEMIFEPIGTYEQDVNFAVGFVWL